MFISSRGKKKGILAFLSLVKKWLLEQKAVKSYKQKKI